ncbi:hypothetical protein Ddc_13980 [Ditylenchus destructor]|nr:hypothetical protein Ddc_13980 [Ditylenchus destructor]
MVVYFSSADDLPGVPAQVQPLANGLEQGKSQLENAAGQVSNGMPGMSGMPNPSNFSSGMKNGMENAFNEGKQQVENGAMQGGMQLASGASQLSNMSPVNMPSVPGGGSMMSKVGSAAGNMENLVQMPGDSSKDQAAEAGGDGNDVENGDMEAPKNGTKGEKKKGKKKGHGKKGKKHGGKKHSKEESEGGSVSGTADGSGAEMSASVKESK